MSVIVDFDTNGNIAAFNREGKLICIIPPVKYAKTISVLKYHKTTKNICKYFFKEHGTTPTYVRKRINAFMKERVFDAAPNCNKLLFKGPRIGVGHLWGSFEHEDIALQCKKDGIENVIPAVVLFGKNPQELKNELGKSIWKKICKNSYSKNRMIFHAVAGNRISFQSFQDFVDVPYTLARSKNVYQHRDLWKHIKNSGLPMNAFSDKKHPEFRKARTIVTMFMDTNRMALQLQQPFNPEWSVRRMHEEHERLTRMQRGILRKESELENSLRFDEFQQLPVVLHNGCRADPLLTRAEVILEGEEMSHCVGGYATSCARGHYVVYSLNKDCIRTTLGIDRIQNQDKSYKYVFSQHYGKFNNAVTDADFIETAVKVVQELNKKNKVSAVIET